MLWKRKKGKPETDPGKNRIDELVDKLQQQGEIDQLEMELQRFDPEGLTEAEKESWYHMYGVAPFRKGDRALAFERFQEGLKHCPDSGVLSFSLGQEYELRADLSNMLALFDRARFPRIPAQYALAQARYAYLWNQYDKALSYVEPLIPVYFKLKILDDTFLYIRGVPFFSQTWAYLAAFHLLLGDLAELKKLTRRAEAECSDFDFQYLHAELRGIESGDFSDLKRRLRASIVEAERSKRPAGHHSMRYHILEAQAESSIAAAEKLLESVRLAGNDFPWLDDMRLLARCELAHRSSNEALEADLQDQFLARQPLLFEPDNAITFNLLRYQENLKAKYQQTRDTGRAGSSLHRGNT